MRRQPLQEHIEGSQQRRGGDAELAKADAGQGDRFGEAASVDEDDVQSSSSRQPLLGKLRLTACNEPSLSPVHQL